MEKASETRRFVEAPMWYSALVRNEFHDELHPRQVPDVTMAYWDKGSKESRKNGIPASLTNKYIELDGEVRCSSFGPC